MSEQQERETCAHPDCEESEDLDLETIENADTGQEKNAWLCPEHAGRPEDEW